MATFTGIVRVKASAAKLETSNGSYVLVPYPQQTPLAAQAMRDVGKDLFSYLESEEVKVSSTLSGSIIYNARLVVDAEKIADKRIDPSAKDKDPLALEMEQHFKKDSKVIAAKLNDVGIGTASALYHRIRNDRSEVGVFSRYLKVPEQSIKEFLSALASKPENASLVRASPRLPVRRGVNLSGLAKVRGVPVKTKAPTTPPKFPAAARTPNLPSKVDLTPYVTPVKNQGLRGTCVAHTAAACLEADYCRKAGGKPNLDLSEHYMYWACKQIDGAMNSEGTFIEYAVEVLLNGVPKEKLPGGVCLEKRWKYNRNPVAGNESQGPLPKGVRKLLSDNKQHRASRVTQIKHNSIKAIKTALADNRCVGLSVYTYHFWTDDYAWREGVISLPLSIAPDGAHAICLVGYRDNDADHADGYFIFKNSWDTTWGHGRPDPGFGSLPYRYVLKEAIEAYTVTAGPV